MTNAGEVKFLAITEQSGKKGEKGSFLDFWGYLAPTWEEKKNLETILLLFFILFFQHFRCIENCLSLPICYIFFGLVYTIIFKYC